MEKMFEVDNIDSDKYLIKMNVDEKEHYTMHTHIILKTNQ